MGFAEALIALGIVIALISYAMLVSATTFVVYLWRRKRRH